MKIFAVIGGRSLAALVLCAAALGGIAHAASAPVERIDPPSWWTGMRSPELQLMLHGPGVGELSAELAYPGVHVVSTTRLRSPNYLFVTLRIDADAPAGSVPIVLKRAGRFVARCDYPLNARRPGSADRAGFGPQDAIYLLMPDRFANGNPANDRAPGLTDVVDRHRPGARHGGDLAGVAAHLDYIEQMGFTQLWMTPVLENAQAAYSYHGYSITDHYRVDPRFGSNEDLRRLGALARERHVGLISDIVINHIGSGHWWMRDLPSDDWLSGAGTTRLTNHMHTTVQDPYASAADRRWYLDGWFDRSMPDLHPATAELGTYLIQNAIWWIEYADLSGLRIDTYSYSDKDYMARFTGAVRAEYPRLNIVGEEWRGHPALVAYWQEGKQNPDGYVSHLPSLMDFPTQAALVNSLKARDTDEQALRSLYENLSEDFLYANPANLVVFSENHDTDRTLHALGEDTDLWWMAQVYVATIRGIPQFLYGSELLLSHAAKATDDDARMDFPGGWSGDAVDGFTGRNLPAPARDAQARLRALLNWRKGSAAVARGALLHYVPVEGVYVYFRQLGAETVMVILNKAGASRTLDVGRFAQAVRPGWTGRDVVSGRDVVLGTALEVPARSATVLDLRDPCATATVAAVCTHTLGAVAGVRP